MIEVGRTNKHLKGSEMVINSSLSVNMKSSIFTLQHADDALMFYDNEEDQIGILRSILVLFGGVSVLHINWRKSHVYPINEVPNVEELAIILGGEIGALPTTYLGMPSDAKSRSKNIGFSD